MKRSFKLIGGDEPLPSKNLKTDWSKCLFCQKVKNEKLSCPAEWKFRTTFSGYETI